MGFNSTHVSRGGSGTYSVNDRRSYDAWGGIRQGNLQGDPKQTYCANLGHRADDETGFIYMRARYYEPSTARFLSEDTSCDGVNFYAYCGNNPIGRYDFTGNSFVPAKPGEDLARLGWYAAGCLLAVGCLEINFFTQLDPAKRMAMIASALAASATFFDCALDDSVHNKSFEERMASQFLKFASLIMTLAAALSTINNGSVAIGISKAAIMASVVRDCQILGALNGCWD